MFFFSLLASAFIWNVSTKKQQYQQEHCVLHDLLSDDTFRPLCSSEDPPEEPNVWNVE